MMQLALLVILRLIGSRAAWAQLRSRRKDEQDCEQSEYHSRFVCVYLHFTYKNDMVTRKRRLISMGKYVIKQGKTGPYFVLKAANGEPIGKSEVYSSEAAAKNGIESVKKNAPIAGTEDQTVEGWKNMTNPVFELYKDKAGEFRFRLRAKNGEPILASEGYSAKASAIGGIESVKKNADSEIVTE